MTHPDPYAMAADLTPALRAEMDRALASAIDGVIERCGEFDDLDILDANVEMTGYLISRFDPHQLAVIGAMLALRLRRSQLGGEGGS